MTTNKYAVHVGRLAGKNVYRFPIEVRFNNPMGTIDDWCSPPRIRTDCLSHTAADAANWAQEHIARHRENTEVEVIGPKGGVTRRFTGYESAIWHQMISARHDQPDLF